MFQDIGVSKNLIEQYRTHCETKKIEDTGRCFFLVVLTCFFSSIRSVFFSRFLHHGSQFEFVALLRSTKFRFAFGIKNNVRDFHRFLYSSTQRTKIDLASPTFQRRSSNTLHQTEIYSSCKIDEIRFSFKFESIRV